jgi:hypothetical protein
VNGVWQGDKGAGEQAGVSIGAAGSAMWRDTATLPVPTARPRLAPPPPRTLSMSFRIFFRLVCSSRTWSLGGRGCEWRWWSG